MVEAIVARFTGDFDRSVELCEQAIELGRRHGVHDLVAMAIHVEGITLVASGRVPEGFIGLHVLTTRTSIGRKARAKSARQGDPLVRVKPK